MMIVYEYASAYRNIYLKDPGEAPADSWMGQSYGRWDGDTFVIDVTAQNNKTWFDRSGNHHSDQLHVVERYTLVKPDVINGSRRKRIAAGAGVDVSDVNKILKMQRQMSDVMKKMGKGGRGMMGALGGMNPQMLSGLGGGMPPGLPPGFGGKK